MNSGERLWRAITLGTVAVVAAVTAQVIGGVVLASDSQRGDGWRNVIGALGGGFHGTGVLLLLVGVGIAAGAWDWSVVLKQRVAVLAMVLCAYVAVIEVLTAIAQASLPGTGQRRALLAFAIQGPIPEAVIAAGALGMIWGASRPSE